MKSTLYGTVLVTFLFFLTSRDNQGLSLNLKSMLTNCTPLKKVLFTCKAKKKFTWNIYFLLTSKSHLGYWIGSQCGHLVCIIHQYAFTLRKSNEWRQRKVTKHINWEVIFFIINLSFASRKHLSCLFLDNNLPWYSVIRFIHSISGEIDSFYKAKQTYPWTLWSLPSVLVSLCLAAEVFLKVIS